ncbi:MAG: NAD-dependent epimerase/dehydratase [Caulobacteraceae bacterium]|nr:NAD-dependent epimerase/dehydratase [Caulobacteraceae bacterium]
MRRVLITGGDGFVGREAAAGLRARGYEVQIVEQEPRSPGSHGLDLLNDDPAPLLDRLKPSHLLHLAWSSTPGQFWTDPLNDRWVVASERLFHAFAAAGGRRFIGAGSCSEYDWSHAVLDEVSTPLQPHTLYGQCKAELYRRLAAQAPILGVSFAWGRIFFLYGPSEKRGRLVGDLIDSLRERRTFDTSEGLQRRDYMHVADAGEAFAALVDSEVQGAVNIASGVSVPVRQLVETAATMLNGLDLVRFGARPPQVGEPPVMEANVQRLRDEVGFSPRLGLEAGLRDAVERRTN